MSKPCEKCNKQFEKKVNESKTFWASRRYCSHSCANSVNSLDNKGCVGRTPWNKGLILGRKVAPIKKLCIQCESEYMVKPYRKDIAKYCTKKCSEVARDEGKSTLYKRIRKSAQYKQWRTLVFERDDYTCQDCELHSGNGKTVVLHADHIKPFAFYPELRFELTNGRTLCIDCHKKTGTYGFKAWRLAQEA
jgi:5-methylcytosine-specific restriction endonuclease McrA